MNLPYTYCGHPVPGKNLNGVCNLPECKRKFRDGVLPLYDGKMKPWKKKEYKSKPLIATQPEWIECSVCGSFTEPEHNPCSKCAKQARAAHARRASQKAFKDKYGQRNEEIRAMRKDGVSTKEIAEKFSLSVGSIRRIAPRKLVV